MPRVDDPARLDGVAALGMDDTAFLSATRWRRTQFVSGLAGTDTGRLLDVVPDRTARAVMGWLAERDRPWLERVGVVALDPHRATPTRSAPTSATPPWSSTGSTSSGSPAP